MPALLLGIPDEVDQGSWVTPISYRRSQEDEVACAENAKVEKRGDRKGPQEN
ncbi:MAG TPA: hypothetical protein VJX30_07490 [Terriglobales bacterium]|nr:hypothetical protein [Terriglobales bacterium]